MFAATILFWAILVIAPMFLSSSNIEEACGEFRFTTFIKFSKEKLFEDL